MNQNKSVVILIIFLFFISLWMFVKGLKDIIKIRSGNVNINLYDSLDFIIMGSISFPLALLLLIYFLNVFQWMTLNRFCVSSSILLTIDMFLSGLFVILNKELMDNSLLIYFGPRKLIISIVILMSISMFIYAHGF